MRKHRHGFTLIELVVVSAIVGTLIGLLLPAVQKIRESAGRITCVNNLKQIGLACQHYHDTLTTFPPGYTVYPGVTDPKNTAPGWGWAAYILPYVEQSTLSQRLDFRLPIPDPANRPSLTQRVKVYECPSDAGLPASVTFRDGFGQVVCQAAPCSYAATFGAGDLFVDVPGRLDGVFYANSHVRIEDITDGASNTVLIGDRAWSQAQGVWAGAVDQAVLQPGPLNPWRSATARAYNIPLVHNTWINIRTDADGGLDDFSSGHPSGVNLLFADGSVHFLADLIAPGPAHNAFMALGTRSGGEIIQGLDY